MKLWSRLIVLALAGVSIAARAQEYPTKPVHFVISFTAGSATDIVGRAVGAKLGEMWGQPVVVDNRAGAGGSIATAAVVNAAPDGYTLLVNSSAHAINPSLYVKLPYDTLKDLVSIAPLAGQPNVLVVNAESPIKSLAALLAAAKANPGGINFASAGIGSATHLNLEKFVLATGIKIEHVPYKGTPEVVKDLLGGRVTAYFAPISAGIGQIRGGKLRALAVSSAKRSSQLQDVPTIAESGVPGFDFSLWFGVWAPAGLPARIVDKINKDVNRALSSPDLKDQLAKLGNDTIHMSPDEFKRFVQSEVEDTARIVKAAGIKPI